MAHGRRNSGSLSKPRKDVRRKIRQIRRAAGSARPQRHAFLAMAASHVCGKQLPDLAHDSVLRWRE